MGSLSSLLTKKQDKNMNEEHEKQQDIQKHLLDKLPIGDVINCPLCGGETTFLDPDKCMTIDCPNCIF